MLIVLILYSIHVLGTVGIGTYINLASIQFVSYFVCLTKPEFSEIEIEKKKIVLIKKI